MEKMLTSVLRVVTKKRRREATLSYMKGGFRST